jgi:tetratricopeptide (TPR) repeat protein
MTCKKCNAEIAENAKFCPECGAKVETDPVCSNCGVKLVAGAKFCPECGTKVGAVTRDTVTRDTVSDKAENPRVREHLDEANELLEKEEYAKAIAEYTLALKTEPENVEALTGRGTAYSDAEEYGKARTDLKKAVRLAEAGDDTEAMARAYNTMGHTYGSEAKYDKAIEFYEKAIALDDKNVTYYKNCGDAYLADGNGDKAGEYFERAVELDPENTEALIWRGKAYFGNKEYGKAIAEYTRALELDPENTDALIWRGMTYSVNEEYGKARSDYQKHIRLVEAGDDTEGMAWAYISLGDTYFDEKKYGKAIAEYTSALEIEPENIKALFLRGNAYADAEEYGKARADLEKAVRLAEAEDDTGTMASAYHHLGHTYNMEAKYDKAIEFYEKAIALDGENAEYYAGCGSAYLLCGNEDKAEEYFERAIELDPDSEESIKSLKKVCEEDNTLRQKTMTAFEEFYDVNVQAHIDKAKKLDEKEAYAEAIDECTLALEGDAENFEALFMRGMLYIMIKKLSKARSDYQKLIRLAEAGDDTGRMALAYKCLGDTYRNEGKYDKAIEFYEKAVALDDKDASYYQDCGEAYFFGGNKDKAEEYFERAVELNPYLEEDIKEFKNSITEADDGQLERQIVITIPNDWEEVPEDLWSLKEANNAISFYTVKNAKKGFNFEPNHPVAMGAYAMCEVEPENYVTLNSFHNYCQSIKRQAFLELCANLGAKEIYIENAEINNREIDLQAGASKKLLGEFAGSYGDTKKSSSGEMLAFTFSQENSGIRDYSTPWLASEPTWKAMYNMRKRNHVKTFDAEFNYTNDYGINGDLSAKFLGCSLNIGGSFHEMTEVRIKYKVVFW